MTEKQDMYEVAKLVSQLTREAQEEKDRKEYTKAQSLLSSMRALLEE